MKILYISNEYPPETGFGGIGTYTKHAAEGMTARGHCVHVLSRSSTGIPGQYDLNGVTIHRVPLEPYKLPEGKLFYLFRNFCYRQIPHTLQRMAWAAAVRKTVSKLLDDHTFDIIEYPECGAEGFFLKNISKQVVRLHTPWYMIRILDTIQEPILDRFILTTIEKIAVRNATHITSPSLALAKIIKKEWKTGDIRVIPNFLPSNGYKPSQGTDWIYTGRIEKRKGVDILICAYAQLCMTHNPPRLKLIGRAYGILPDKCLYGDYIKKLISENGMNERSQWIEGVDHDDIQMHLQNSSVAIFPSIWENFPYTCLEAMACGLTVIASDTGGFPELIKNNMDGLLVKVNDVHSLSAAMELLLQDVGLRKKLGECAYFKIKNQYDSSLTCETLEQCYLECLTR
jgi:glycosyltransferase involved in cell wall biosynthesis